MTAPRMPAIVGAKADARHAERHDLLDRSASGNDAVFTESDPITRRDGGAAVPLTPGQEDLLATINMFRGFYAGGGWHNLWISLLAQGPLDLANLRRSIADIVRRHESLRTTFPVADGSASIKISPPADSTITEIDLTSLSPAAHAAEVARIVAADANVARNLSEGPLVHFTFLRLDRRTTVIVAIVDHMVFDGWSFGVFARELSSLYQARTAGPAASLPELPIQYGDYAVWEKRRLSGASIDAARSYWHAQLARPLATFLLPSDRKRELLQRFSPGRSYVRLSARLSERAVEFSRRNNVSLFATLLAAFKTLLSRYTGEGDVAVASAMVNRLRPDLHQLIGLFSNIVILRSDLRDNPCFAVLARRVRQTIAAGLAHQDFPFGHVHRELFPRSMPFRIFFTFQNYPSPRLDLHPARVTPLDISYGSGLWELNVILATSPAGLYGTISYNRELFHSDSIARILQDYQSLLAAALKTPTLPISELSGTRHQ